LTTPRIVPVASCANTGTATKNKIKPMTQNIVNERTPEPFAVMIFLVSISHPFFRLGSFSPNPIFPLNHFPTDHSAAAEFRSWIFALYSNG
jgi:hypothetical protein